MPFGIKQTPPHTSERDTFLFFNSWKDVSQTFFDTDISNDQSKLLRKYTPLIHVLAELLLLLFYIFSIGTSAKPIWTWKK